LVAGVFVHQEVIARAPAFEIVWPDHIDDVVKVRT
jgi:hypothetical protein